MNQEVKAKWVAALRSGEYEQASGQLRDSGHSYCCLGVLCAISGLGDWSRANHLEATCYRVGDDTGVEYPPLAVMEWADFDYHEMRSLRIPTVLIKRMEKPLHCHNDDGSTFAEIADAIEGQL